MCLMKSVPKNIILPSLIFPFAFAGLFAVVVPFEGEGPCALVGLVGLVGLSVDILSNHLDSFVEVAYRKA